MTKHNDLTNFVKENLREVRNICIGIARGANFSFHDAEDIYQETCLKVLSADNYKPSKNPRPFIATICINLCRNEMRMRKKERERVGYNCSASYRMLQSGEEIFPIDEVESREKDPSEKMEEIDDVRIALDNVDRLPYVQRISLIGRVMGMSYNEIAKTYNIRIGSVGSGIYFAKKRMRGMFYSK